ncbi:MAG: MTH1187 family thiamine-binding protein [Calditrichota bacterium]
MAIVAVSIAPSDAGGVSLSKYVAAAEQALRDDGRVNYRLDPMFTTLEGDLDVCFEVIRKMQEAVFAAGSQRVGTVIKIDDRRDKAVRMEDKIASVEGKLKG